MKKLLLISVALLIILFAACGNNNTKKDAESGGNAMYEQISPKDAKRIMDSGEEYILLDVREQNEYDEGQIKGAVLIPYTEIEDRAESELLNKNEQILVYCRSGRRSKIAAESLVRHRVTATVRNALEYRKHPTICVILYKSLSNLILEILQFFRPCFSEQHE